MQTDYDRRAVNIDAAGQVSELYLINEKRYLALLLLLNGFASAMAAATALRRTTRVPRKGRRVSIIIGMDDGAAGQKTV